MDAPQKGSLKEYSVIYTDRAWNLMSTDFQECMRDIDMILKEAYSADCTALVPGAGTYAMEAVARALGQDQKVLVVRNGYFSFRWSDIFECCKIPSSETVMKARVTEEKEEFSSIAPCPIDEVVAKILEEKPAAVFAPHVETSAGIILSDDYISKLADAVHKVGGLLVMDCIAAGTIFLDMKKTGCDVVISAPQKGWTAPACVGIVCMNEKAKKHIMEREMSVNSFCCNLQKWIAVMDKYTIGKSFMYYTTLPTDALMTMRDAMMETRAYGFDKATADAIELGTQIRAILEKNGFKSVAADGVKAPSVVVSFAKGIEGMVGKFKEQGIQVAGGVPLKIGEPFDGRKSCFRIGLFGLDKFGNIKRTVSTFEKALASIQ